MLTSMIEIRDEQPADGDRIRDVNRLAFGQEQEGRIVDVLRARGAILQSLVAVADGAIVGHILFSPVRVGTLAGAGLGPMAVLPAYQRQGIGSRLVERGLAQLRDTDCPFVVVLGHPAFYPRFGFTSAAAQGLTCEWDVPADVFMVNVLDPRIADRLQGVAEYPREFSE
jgi:putative acetyltransferase